MGWETASHETIIEIKHHSSRGPQSFDGLGKQKKGQAMEF